MTPTTTQTPLTKALVLLLGCALLPACVTLGMKFTLEGLEAITVGKSKMADVRAALGNPITEEDLVTRTQKEVHFGDATDATEWAYVYANASMLGGGNARVIVVQFDKNGKVTNYQASSNFKEDMTHDPEEKDLRDFDILSARKALKRGVTTGKQVKARLGDPSQMTTIHKPGVKVRWIYRFHKREEKAILQAQFISRRHEEHRTFYKLLMVDMGPDDKVVDFRGKSDFPDDKDLFFTK